MAISFEKLTLPRLKLAARYRMFSSELNRKIHAAARRARERLTSGKRREDDGYDEPWVRDMVERS